MKPDLHPSDVLTLREQSVLRLLAQGLSNKELAEKLMIVEKTVESHLTHIFAKLGVKTRTQAVLWINQHAPNLLDKPRDSSDVEATLMQIS